MNLRQIISRTCVVLVTLLFATLAVRAEVRLHIEDFTIEKGDTATLSLLLTNDTKVTGFQVDLTLPTGIALVGKTEVAFTKTGRLTASHSVSAVKQEEGAIRLLAFSSSNEAISGSSGAVVSFKVTATQSFDEAKLLALTNQMVGGADGTKHDLQNDTTAVSIILNNKWVETPVSVITLSKTSMTLEPKQTMELFAHVFPNDADSLRVSWSSSNTKVATVSESGVVTALSDGEATITASATDNSGKSAKCIVSVVTTPKAEIALWIDTVQISQDETKTIEIMLENDVDVTGFQTDLILPEGLSIATDEGETGVGKTSRLSSAHQVSIQKKDSREYRIVVFSSSNAAITGHSGAVVTVNLQADAGFIHQDVLQMKETRVGSASGIRKDLADADVIVMGRRKIIVELKAEDITIGESGTLSLLIDNKGPLTGIQADLILPAGVSLVEKSLGKTERLTKDHEAMITAIDENGRYRILLFSNSNATIGGDSGAVAHWQVKADSCEIGKCLIELKNIKIGAADGTRYDLPDLSSMMLCNSAVLGDVNNDCTISQADVTMLADYLLARPLSSINLKAADANQNGNVSVADMPAIISLILSK